VLANGNLQLEGTTLNVGDTFTQLDITNGLVTYEKTNEESTPDSFTFDIEAPLINISSEAAIDSSSSPNVSFDSVYNQSNNGTTNNRDVNLTYTLTAAPVNGDLLLEGTTLNVGDTFTQLDIVNGIITYDKTNQASTQDSFAFEIEPFLRDVPPEFNIEAPPNPPFRSSYW